MNKFWWFIIRIGLSFVLTCLVMLMFRTPRDGVLSALMIMDMAAKDKPSFYKTITAEPSVLSDSIRMDDGKWLYFDIYRTDETKATAGMIVTHGFTENGKDDKRLQSMAKRLARAGFVIMVPDLTHMKEFRLSFQDVDELALCFDHFKNLKSVDSNKIGMMAFSFGTGPVLISMTRPEISERVKFGVLFGGYYDLKRSLKYTLTGAYDAEGYSGQGEVTDKNDRWEFLLGNSSLVKSDGTFEYLIQKKIDDMEYDIMQDAMWLTEEEMNVLAFINNADPERFDELYEHIPASFKTWIDTLSLYHYSERIQSKLLIGHSEGDRVVHYTESLSIARNVPNAPEPFVVVMGLFTHVNLKIDWESLPAVLNETLPGLYGLWQLTFQLLQQRI